MAELDYKYIRAWGKLLHSMNYYIIGEVEKARQANAPSDAIYYGVDDKIWHVFGDIVSEDTKSRVQFQQHTPVVTSEGC